MEHEGGIMRLIDADELQERLAQMRNGDILSIREYLTLSGIVSMQDTTSQNHGKWIVEKVQYSEPLEKYTCSECGDDFETVIGIAKKFRYCRSCGAKMEEIEE